MGSRLSVVPANFSKEAAALSPLLEAARAQLAAEPTRRASSALNKERVRNATALLLELTPVADATDGSAHQVLPLEAKPKVQVDLTPRG